MCRPQYGWSTTSFTPTEKSENLVFGSLGISAILRPELFASLLFRDSNFSPGRRARLVASGPLEYP